ncbi:MAG: SDR family oxidoreductase, partial [Croceibacterium sp.]
MAVESGPQLAADVGMLTPQLPCCTGHRNSGFARAFRRDKRRASILSDKTERIDMNGRLIGQSALVTGAGRGFGRSIALRLAADGAAVTLVSRSAGQLDAVAAEIRTAGGKAIVAACDVTDPAQVKAACDAARQTHGAPSLLVSNAGVPWPFGPVWETDIDKWWQAEAVHIRAPYLFMHELMPAMIAAKSGRVICISAIATRLTLPFLSAYSVGKAALNKLVEMAAEEARPHNVQVFAVEPGFVITQLAEDT